MKRHGDLSVRAFAGGAFAENCYLVHCARDGAAALIDPGAAVDEALRAAEADSLRVERIVLTHAHLDHVDGVARARKATGAPVLLHPEALEMYRAAPAQAQMFGVGLDPLPEVDAPLKAGVAVEIGACGLEVRSTPGHAPGHVTLVGDGFAIVGDCVFAGSIGRTDLPGGDFQTLIRSIRSEILTLPDETVLYPGHGPETTVGHERVSNPFLGPHFGGSRFA